MEFQGAEAIVRIGEDSVVKERIAKGYRIKEVDGKMRRERTKAELSILEKCPVPCPEVFESSEFSITMTRVPGERLAVSLEDLDWKAVMEKVGDYLGRMHNRRIIHGDLTTSNIHEHEGEVYFIDFGLSYFSERKEDKAVDLHLFKQALESKHHTIFEEAFKVFLDSYSRSADNSADILKRFEIVEGRGRYKGKG